MRILVINPGSTSTKLAVYDDDVKFFGINIPHPVKQLSKYQHVNDQYEFRKRLILKALADRKIGIDFSAVIGRGGLLKPTAGGVFEINDKILHDLKHASMEHASNLAAPIACEIARMSGPECKAYIADPAVTDELRGLARVTGIPEISRVSVFHALNSRAVARKLAARIDKRYEDMCVIVVHMGGGISVSAHWFGEVVDVNNALNGEGPFSPERAGTLPAAQLVDLCFSGKYTKDEIHKMINGRGGLYAHLGTTNVEYVVENIFRLDDDKKLVFDSMIYNTAKYVGSMHIALKQRTEAIILTGGMAHSRYVQEYFRLWVGGLAPIVVIPGEDEMEALAMNALGVLRGEVKLQVYNPVEK